MANLYETNLFKAKDIIFHSGMTATDLSQHVNFDQSTISKYKNGKRKVDDASYKTVSKFAHYYDHLHKMSRWNKIQNNLFDMMHFDQRYYIKDYDIIIKCSKINLIMDDSNPESPQNFALKIFRYLHEKYNNIFLPDIKNLCFEKSGDVKITFHAKRQAKNFFDDIYKEKIEVKKELRKIELEDVKATNSELD